MKAIGYLGKIEKLLGVPAHYSQLEYDREDRSSILRKI